MSSLLREEEDQDSLASLEERITRAVELVSQLKKQNDQLAARVKAAEAARDQAIHDGQRNADELENLRSERKQVRTRIEKLLGQMDTLNA